VSYFLAVPVLFLAMMFQMVVVNKLSLLYGYADLVLLIIIIYGLHPKAKHSYFWAIVAGLMFGYISKLSIIVPMSVYFLVIWGAKAIKMRIWQMPILAYLFVVIVATFLYQFGSLISLKVAGSILPLVESINLIIIPSVLLNLIFAIPIYYIFNDFLDVVFTEKKL
jgi:cell shape-determining protein MreD